jgi:hypothetical protein
LAAFEANALAFTPNATSSFSVAFATSSYAKSVKAIEAPSCANRNAIALPIPRAAPVMSATFPAKSFIFG